MENLDIVLDSDYDGKDYDAVLSDTLPECGDMKTIVKHGAMTSGKSAVMVTFTVQLPDGTTKRVQAVTSANLFIQAGNLVKGSVDHYQKQKAH